MEKFINSDKLNTDLISSCLAIKKEDIIGAYINTNYFKIFTKKKRRIKNGYYTSNNFKTYKSSVEFG